MKKNKKNTSTAILNDKPCYQESKAKKQAYVEVSKKTASAMSRIKQHRTSTQVSAAASLAKKILRNSSVKNFVDNVIPPVNKKAGTTLNSFIEAGKDQISNGKGWTM